jgi:hypothetical protein
LDQPQNWQNSLNSKPRMKTFKQFQEEWSNKYKKSIDCFNPKGFSQRAHCAGRRKRAKGEQTKSKPVE